MKISRWVSWTKTLPELRSPSLVEEARKADSAGQPAEAYDVGVHLDQYGYARELDPLEALVLPSQGIALLEWRGERWSIQAPSLRAAMAAIGGPRGGAAA